MRLASIATAAALLVATTAHAEDARAAIAVLRQRIETADYRAGGRLVRVDASGNRTSNAITVKARWFPGVLRTLVEIAPAPDSGGKHIRMRASASCSKRDPMAGIRSGSFIRTTPPQLCFLLTSGARA